MPRQSSSIPDAPIPDGPPKTIQEERNEALSGILQVGQLCCLAFGDFSDAGAIGVHGPPMVDETVKLCDENKGVAEKVDILIKVGPYAGIVTTAIPFVVQILCNHGLLKAEQWANAGVVSAESLEYQMKTTIMRQQMEAMQRQKEAEEDLARMQEEMLRSSNGDDPEKEPVDTNAG
jgi:hypothetical protein